MTTTARANKNNPAIQAVIFDMDGVVTQSMQAHFAAWKETFDTFLTQRSERHATFTLADYFAYVDGVARLDGIRRYLASRGIALPEGEPGSMNLNTVQGLATHKNQRFQVWLNQNAVPVHQDAIELIGDLKAHGIKVGVFSASRNAERVLTGAGVIDLFDAKVDGVDAARLDLPPKPAPAMLIETAKRLGAMPASTIVVEDAVSGVEAGAAGGFAHVVGIDREQAKEAVHARALLASGADIVTRDLTTVRDLCLSEVGATEQ